jgi:ABC-type sugar transport system substrate-binding protein
LDLTATALGAIALAGTTAMAEVRKLKQKEKCKVGLEKTESNKSADKLGHQPVYTRTAGSAAKQVADVNSMIAQGVDVIFLAPHEEKPIPAIMAAAKKAGIPVILLDRSFDPKFAKIAIELLSGLGYRVIASRGD